MPADNPSRAWPLDTVWGRKWILCDKDGNLHVIEFGAHAAFLDELERGVVSDDVRRVFESDGRSKVEGDYCHREPSALPARVALEATGVEEHAAPA